MKKYVSISLILIMTLLLVACGGEKASDSASTEISLQPMEEVLKAPTEVKPNDSTSNSVGLMAFYPNNDPNMYALAGTNTLTLYFENKNIALGDGKIGIYKKSDSSIYTSVSTVDKAKFDVGAMDSVGTSLTGWTSGTKIDVYFDKVFLVGEQYYVLMDEGCFKLGQVLSAAVTNSNLINFGVKNYGIDVSHLGLDKEHNVGDVVSFDIMVDGAQASMFAFKEFDETFLTPAPVNSTGDTTASITFLKGGTQDITCAFYKSGKQVDSITFTFKVKDENASATESASNGN